ncbi:MAG: DUF5615 family PIN-like protein [Bacteroidota bacterium]|nr:DUF5615 family PIN-like protein [Bacteroidota bacterium]
MNEVPCRHGHFQYDYCMAETICHDALHVREVGMSSSPDSLILEKAKKENRIVLTCDLDFGALMASSKDKLPSVIIFRLDDETPQNINIRLNEVLSTASKKIDEGAIISIEQNKYRIRQLPIK